LQIPVSAGKFCIGEHGVLVFILGGTGAIGSPIVRELINRGHGVWALARSDISAAKLSQFGVTPIAGDISAPVHWAAKLPRIDAIIHAACDFDTGMGAIGRATSPSRMAR
jgi:nucleoside-diphosphate-sugar epimerase